MFLCEQPSWSFGWLIVGLAPQTAQNGRLFDAYKRAKREGSAQSLEMFVVRKPWGEQKNLIYLKAFFLVQLCWSAKRATRSESTKNYNYTMYKEQKGFGILELCSLLLCVFFLFMFMTCKYTQDASLTPDPESAWGFWDRFESHRKRKRLELTKSSMYRPPMRFRAEAVSASGQEPMTRVTHGTC